MRSALTLAVLALSVATTTLDFNPAEIAKKALPGELRLAAVDDSSAALLIQIDALA
jgi:hypothetical protein